MSNVYNLEVQRIIKDLGKEDYDSFIIIPVKHNIPNLYTNMGDLETISILNEVKENLEFEYTVDCMFQGKKKP